MAPFTYFSSSRPITTTQKKSDEIVAINVECDTKLTLLICIEAKLHLLDDVKRIYAKLASNSIKK